MTAALPADARAMVLTASNRAAAGVYEDRSGKVLAEGLQQLGFDVEGPHVRPDDVAELEAVLRNAVDLGLDLVLTTGGTGLSPPMSRRRRPAGSWSARPPVSPRRCAGTARTTASPRRSCRAGRPGPPGGR